ncbi:uncharacterized protein [Amphiura filiformis]|uniref:uncharacterized protein n=1 Tax=Amphiura filiformis TaxID=82378 RepID=UPI003B21497F
MVHGPCGVLNTHSVCMEDSECTKGYPKGFNDQTNICVDGYPTYRRRDNGATMMVRGVQVDNRWIVPYNPWLSKKYKAHINLEACMSIKSVKYIFKYVYKGHDCANIEVQETSQPDHDEVSTFLDVRYVSAPEAFWRLSEYRMHFQSSTVTRLAVHLPLQQPVYFHRGQEEEALDRATVQHTHLTAWFQLNQDDDTAAQHLYSDIPQHYVFNSSTKKWQPRKRKNKQVIARMYSASPRHQERFYLRLLLLHKPGATNFENLRTIDGHICDSFKDACKHLGLLADDEEWNNALTEASTFQMPRQLRALFATICAQCQPTDPLTLWTTHKQSMIEDYLHHQSSTDAENQALQDIESILLQSGLSCSDVGLPEVQAVREVDEFVDVAAETEYAQTNLAKLNPEQKLLVDTIFAAIQGVLQGAPPLCQAYFLDGPGGTGKTMVYNTLMAALRADGLKVAAAAWTGIAATLLRRGRTVHNLFKLPVPILETSTCNISPTSKHAAMIRALHLIIIDEASMVPVHALHAIDKFLRDLTGHDIPFGGKVFLLGGDFRQVLPVVPRSPPTVIVENCLKRSPLWSDITKISLNKNMRAKPDEKEFATWILKLGNGELQSQCEPTKQDTIDIPPQCVITDNIVNSIFPTANEVATKQVILTPKNEESLLLNNQVLAKLPGDHRTYYSSDKVVCDNDEEQHNYSMEFVNSITPSGMPPHCLQLKKGAVVMLLRNLDIKRGLCNGTRLIIRHLHDNVLDAEILSGDHHGQRVLLPRIRLAPSDPNLPFTLERRQFPLRLAYAMTINKAQGQTFDKVGIYLPSPVFSHGQLYVAFSRARSFSDIAIQLYPSPSQGCTEDTYYTTNVVYPEIL